MGRINTCMTYQTIKLTIPNANNLALATEIYKPNAGEKFPVAFLFHGFTGYKEAADLIDLADRLAKRGIVAVRFTSSGFGDSGGTLEDDYRFSNYRSDADFIYRYVQTLPYIDTTRQGVFGHSMGGKLAVLFCRDHNEVKTLCAASAPVSFFGTAYGSLYDDWKKKGYFEKVSGRDGKTIRVPFAYLTDVDDKKHDVLAAARGITGARALVVAGDSDTEVPWQETEKIFNALMCPKEFIKLSGVPHKYGHEPRLIPVVNAPVADFFVGNL